MKRAYSVLLLTLLYSLVSAQTLSKVDAVKFFTDESVVDVTIGVNLRTVMAHKSKKDIKFPATLTMKIDDGSVVTEPVELEPRGNFRKDYCQVPPLKIDFKSPRSPRFSPLGTLKLVNVCFTSEINTEYLFKEFLVYKMYNMITDKSLRVRLLKITYIDSASKKKPHEEYAFLIEDVKDMAKRNGFAERKRPVTHTEYTERQQMTRVAMFQYMIGNLDWSVKAMHNIKLIAPKEDTNSTAYPVPYDFDYCGLVKTDYALPPEQINVKDVTERSYMGFVRTIEELEAVASEFLAQKQNIYNLINDFTLLPAGTRKTMQNFLNDFFKTISDQRFMRAEFISNARRMQ